MGVSSRTPGGDLAKCPVCGTVVVAEPSLYYSDATCPSCGSLLWFLRLGGQLLVVRPSATAEKKGLIGTLAEITGLSESQLESDPELFSRSELDSTDLVELVMELENE